MFEFRSLYRKRSVWYYYGLEIFSSISISSIVFPTALHFGLGSGHSVILTAALALCIFAALASYNYRFRTGSQIRPYFVALPLLNLGITVVMIHMASVVLW